MSVVNRRKVGQGQHFQDEAKLALERSEFEQAYYYCAEAENLCRQGYDTP